MVSERTNRSVELGKGEDMRKFKFEFGHLTAGKHTYQCKSNELADKVHELVDELYESDSGHYEVYFVAPDDSSMSIFQSGLMSYSSKESPTPELYFLPDSRDTIYEIVIDFLDGNINWWIDRFQPTLDLPAGHTDLFAAARKGQVDYPLHKAATEGDLVEVRGLLKAGYDVNGLDNKRRTPLVLAACMGHLEICKYLVKHGADLRAKDNWGNSIPSLADDYPELAAYFKGLDTQ